MKDTFRLPIIVVGANGRMGRELCRLVGEAPDLVLAGAVEAAANLPLLATLDCPVSESAGELAARQPGSIIIDFTAPQASMRTAALAAEHNTPIVIGSTGFNNDQKMELAALATVTPMLLSANMSVGVNVLLKILPALAAALGPDYDMEIMEIHHRHKKDAPSGTALMLADALARARSWELDETRVSCRDGITGERKDREIGVQALRGGDVPGIHETYFLGQGEFIKVTHLAESRENFARGALRAARWLASRPAGPLYSMGDVIWPDNGQLSTTPHK